MKKTLLSAAAAVMLFAAGPALAEDAASGDIFIKSQKLTEYLAKDRLIGAKVKNAAGEIVGDIEDLIIDNDDHVSGVIMGVGGFLGIGEKNVALSLPDIKFMRMADGTLVGFVTSTKKQLQDMPAFTPART